MNIVTDLSRKVSYNYFVKQKYEAGVILFGWEVKCVRVNGINLVGAFVSINTCFNVILFGSVVNISNFVFNYSELESSRNRFLLLKKKEILYVYSALKVKGYTLIPLKAYWKNSFLKIELALCIGKKLYDKRQILKNKDTNKDLLNVSIN